MGCGASKVDERPLVMLCKERRDLMRNAANLRFFLSSTHASYFQALESAGEALNRFLEEEFAASSPSFTPSSPVLTIPSSQGKRHKSESKSTSSSATSLSHSLSLEDSNLHVPSETDEIRYSMWQSSTNPTSFYEAPPSGYGNWAGYGGQDTSSFYNNGVSVAPATPPQPAPASSTWGFLNFFDISQEDYSFRRYGSVASSPNSSLVREREGIPELEEETESEAMGELGIDKRTRDKRARKKLSGKNVGVGERESSTGSDGNLVRGSRGISSQGESSSKEKESAEDDEQKKDVSLDEGTSVPTSKNESNLETGVSVNAARTVTEVAQELKKQFRLAASSAVEVSAVLDVGAPKYRSDHASNRVTSSRFLDALSMLMCSCSSFEQLENSTANSLRFAKAWYEDSGNRVSERSGRLSSALDMLSIWENKLYETVKYEENLSLLYKKKCRRLQHLDESGAESQKVEAVQASISQIRAELDISLKSIAAISRRIHRLRDEVLQPLIIDLIRRLIVMWRSLLDCHRKQFMAVIQSKSRSLTARTAVQRGSTMKITRDLELEMFNWLCCFHDWVDVQKKCFFIMNEWLRRCICIDDIEEAPDGAPPYSPGRSGAPQIFVIFNDLADAMGTLTLSQQHVSAAMEACIDKIQSLRLTQDAAQGRRQIADQLSKELANRLQSRNSSSTAFPTELAKKLLEMEKVANRVDRKEVSYRVQSSFREGLIPVFNELGNFAVEILRAYESVRLSPQEKEK